MNNPMAQAYNFVVFRNMIDIPTIFRSEKEPCRPERVLAEMCYLYSRTRHTFDFPPVGAGLRGTATNFPLVGIAGSMPFHRQAAPP